MSKKFTAVLINVTGIQQFIFHSNKLKENIGASYIIENEIYGENVMMKILNEMESLKNALQLEWVKQTNVAGELKKDYSVEISKDASVIKCEIGYIGGGNALLLFLEEKDAKMFISTFSKKVLEMYPSLQLVFGLTTDFDLTNYKLSYDKLMQNLKERKSSYIPLTTIPKHGITADCPWSNDSAESPYKEPQQKEEIFISKASHSKILATKTAQRIEIQQKMYPSLKETIYELTQETDHLGQEKESSYIAVVHIDGNGMGKIFSNINTLEELRKTSEAVSTKATTAMDSLLNDLICKAKAPKTKGERGDIDDLFFYDGKVLPIRPILVGGDDITFICEGRLGMYLAEKFISLFYNDIEQAKSKTVNDIIKEAEASGKTKEEIKTIEIDAKKKHNVLMDGACAGVAIVKTHFPFYKAVHLAEELCAEAKKVSRATKGSYISYYYSATTFSGSLAQLRERTQTTALNEKEIKLKHEVEGIKDKEVRTKNMYFGPYRLFVPESQVVNKEFPDVDKAIEKLKAGIKEFNDDKKYPKNKVMALREAIIASESAQDLFVKELKEQLGHKINIWKSKTEKTEDSKEKVVFYTEYFDQIELMDFYLDSLL